MLIIIFCFNVHDVTVNHYYFFYNNYIIKLFFNSRKNRIARAHLGKNLFKKLFVVIFNLRIYNLIYVEKLDIFLFIFLST